MSSKCQALSQLLAERDALVGELTRALDKVKTLKGLLPMCSHCKKIRDGQGYWQQVEVYIEHYSEAEFTHGLCRSAPGSCIRKLTRNSRMIRKSDGLARLSAGQADRSRRTAEVTAAAACRISASVVGRPVEKRTVPRA